MTRAAPRHRDDLYTHAALSRVLAPRSIAVLGASPRPGAFGDRVIANLARYGGAVHPVNAKYAQIRGLACHPSVAAIPGGVDCAVIVTSREAVEPLAREAIAAGVGGIVVFASGYAETGRPERAAEQERLAALAHASGVPIIGPNCIGITDYALGMRITFMPDAAIAAPAGRAIGVVSQSGALGFALEQAAQRGVAISHVLTSGNSCDVDMADFVAYLADDPSCGAIALLFEGMAQPARLVSAARRAAAVGKPLVVCKIATGDAGAQAAMSHTGSLAGADAAWRAVLAREGAVVVDDFEALAETASFFLKAPARPLATGVAVICTSGGAGIMAADKAERHSVPLPQPRPEAMAVLAARIPEYGAARNPCDVTAMVLNDPDSLSACAHALAADPAYGALALPSVYASPLAAARVPFYGALAREHGKPVCIVWLPEWLEGPGANEMERDPDVVLFRSMDRCFASIAAWHRRAAALVRGEPVRVAPAVRDAARATLTAAGPMLAEREAKALLAGYGIPVVEEVLATSAAAAVAAAARLGSPVAMKIESPDIPHKTEAGVIRLGVAGEAAVCAAYAELMQAASRIGGARIAGVLVQPMVPRGIEILLGARVDPMFGPMVAVGLGGIFVELLRDTVLAPAPLAPAEARAMLEGLRGAAIFRGFRGLPPVDLDRLADILCGLGAFVADHADVVAEVDINPLIATRDGLVAVDALIVKRAG
ncbi:MAG: acetate--CoA ligase family protein [Rhodospirillales bacterium]|nr:acetate--CoA ligase family protein [Rhodospirillales bacterium]